MAGEIFPSLANILAPHGPPVGAKLMSFVPGDYSIHFFLQLALIVLACRGVGWFCHKYLAQPQVVGEMIAGVILGPSLFGLVAPDLQAMVFPGKPTMCFMPARNSASRSICSLSA